MRPTRPGLRETAEVRLRAFDWKARIFRGENPHIPESRCRADSVCGRQGLVDQLPMLRLQRLAATRAAHVSKLQNFNAETNVAEFCHIRQS